MKNRRLQIVNVDWILFDVEAKVVGAAMYVAAFYTSACHPQTEGIGMVIATFLAGRAATTDFSHRGAPKFASAENQRFVE